jgi:hypothetical protein
MREATPHLGSSYLSRDEFVDTIRRELRLHRPLPLSLRTELRINTNPILQEMVSSFRSLAADLRVWTFYEAEDTNLTREMPNAQTIPLLAPIASIKSTYIDLYHEDDNPLLTTHLYCASFWNSDDAKEHYITQLKAAVGKAFELSKTVHHDLSLEEKVEVEVHGFFEGIIESAEPRRPITLYSRKQPLREFLDNGPSRCLSDRLEEDSVPPTASQVIKSSGSRAQSLSPPVSSEDSSLKTVQLKGAADDRHKGRAGGNRPLPKTEGSFLKNAFSKTSKSNEGATKLAIKPAFSQRPSFETRLSQTGSQPRLTDVTEEHASPGSSTTNPASEAAASERGDLTNVAGGALGSTAPTSQARRSSVDGKRSSGVESIDFANTQTSSSRPQSEIEQQNRSTNEPRKAPPTSFRRPDVRDRKLTWIHVPFNNPPWVAVSDLACFINAPLMDVGCTRNCMQ